MKSEATSHLNLVCDRCLSEFTDRVKDSFTIYYTRDREAIQNDDEEVMQLTPGTAEIDLSKGLRESILLGTSMKVLCRKDCKGLCQSCGKNLNEVSCHCKRTTYDPRWDGLKALLNRDAAQ